MKLLLISDLHTTINKQRLIETLKNTDYDIICLLGDNSELDLDIITGNAKNVLILGILGNHDLLTLYDNYSFIKHIDNKLYNENNLSFTGIDGSLRYKDNPNIAMRTENEFLKIINELPNADILLSHAGPIEASNQIDTIHHFIDFSKYYDKTKLKYHFFGHYHINKAFIIKKDNHYIKCLCVYGCVAIDTENDNYKILMEE